MLERGFNVYSINPKQLDRFRDRFTVSGAKDDSRDADVLADSLRTDMRAFRKISIAEPIVVELIEWSRIAPGSSSPHCSQRLQTLCNAETIMHYEPCVDPLQ